MQNFLTYEHQRCAQHVDSTPVCHRIFVTISQQQSQGALVVMTVGAPSMQRAMHLGSVIV